MNGNDNEINATSPNSSSSLPQLKTRVVVDCVVAET